MSPAPKVLLRLTVGVALVLLSLTATWKRTTSFPQRDLIEPAENEPVLVDAGQSVLLKGPPTISVHGEWLCSGHCTLD